MSQHPVSNKLLLHNSCKRGANIQGTDMMRYFSKLLRSSLQLMPFCECALEGAMHMMPPPAGVWEPRSETGKAQHHCHTPAGISATAQFTSSLRTLQTCSPAAGRYAPVLKPRPGLSGQEMALLMAFRASQCHAVAACLKASICPCCLRGGVAGTET